MKISLYPLLMIWILLWSCKPANPQFQVDSANPILIQNSLDKLTDIIVHDIFSPPVASRNYAYPCIAAYEVIRHGTNSYRSLAGQLNELDPTPEPDASKEYCFPLAANIAFIRTAKSFIFSEDKLDAYELELMREYEEINIPTAVFQNSIEYGEAVSAFILAWAKKDNYNQSRSFPKFNVSDDPAEWKPTPPAYLEGIEPHWREIRPFVLNDAKQFRPGPPTEFNLNKETEFYNEIIEVYDAVNKATDEHIAIAKFWDCNPFVMNVTGHVMHATKKITPGGHWMNIASIACRKSNSNIYETLKTYTLTSIAVADGFISCWDEKYRSNLIRPETVINETIDENWVPLLQTPPFPEHTSGHSVISTAAAVALTSIYGDSFSFDDDSELKYGLPIRSFNSFFDASSEAAISRLYGGIHYRPAIDLGVIQGKKVGEYVVGEIEF